MAKKILWISVFLNIALILYFPVNLIRNHVVCDNLLRSSTILKQENKMLLNYFWKNNFISTKRINLDVANNEQFLKLKNNYHIGLWISDKQCGACVDSCIQKIGILPDSIRSKIVVFMDEKNPRIKIMQQKKIPDSIPIINYSFYDSDNIFLSPVFAMISPSLEISNVFNATPTLPSVTDYYFEKISLYLK